MFLRVSVFDLYFAFYKAKYGTSHKAQEHRAKCKKKGQICGGFLAFLSKVAAILPILTGESRGPYIFFLREHPQFHCALELPISCLMMD